MAGAYIRGKLALAGVDLSVDCKTWLDAAYAVWIDAPYEALEKANVEMVKAMARLRPEAARETWGLLPQHQAMTGKLGRQQAPHVGPKSTSAEVQAWQAKQATRPRRK